MVKPGDEVVAIQDCFMTNNGEQALTLGKTYIVVNIWDAHFSVTDDRGKEHYFNEEHLISRKVIHSEEFSKKIEEIINES